MQQEESAYAVEDSFIFLRDDFPTPSVPITTSLSPSSSSPSLTPSSPTISPASPSSHSWVSEVLMNLRLWLSAAPDVQEETTSPQQSETLWADWEWIMSTTEEFLLQKKENENQHLKQELKSLRKAAQQVKRRDFFISKAREAQSGMEEEQQGDLQVVLDSNKRSKIVGDIVSQFATSWRSFVEDLFFSGLEAKRSDFVANFGEQRYAKNIVGAMKEMAWQASHGPGGVGLTPTVLGEIMWSIWKTLTTSIKEHLSRELTEDEMQAVAKHILFAQESLIHLWLEVSQKSKNGTANAGHLVAKWRQQEEVRKKQLAEIKKKGADAVFSIGKVLIKPTEHSEKIKEISNFLESQLEFRAVHIIQSS